MNRFSMNYLRTTLFYMLALPTALTGMLHSTCSHENPLHVPAIYKEEFLARLQSVLAEKKYDVNEETCYFGTPLSMAIGTKNSAAVALLLEHGADPNQVFGKSFKLSITPLNWCIQTCTSEITALLLKKGAKPYVNPEVPHPLFQIFFRNFFEKNQLYIMAVLLRVGTNPLIVRHNDRTLFEYMACELRILSENLERMLASDAPGAEKQVRQQTEKITHYKQAFKALLEYKRLALQFKKHYGVPLEICHMFLHVADYGLNSPLRKTTTLILSARRKPVCWQQGSAIQP